MRIYSIYLLGALILFITGINLAETSAKQLAQQRCVSNPILCKY